VTSASGKPSVATSVPGVLLIGMRGSGKTTIGALVARRLGRPFVDLDDRAREVLSAPTVVEAFARHGEHKWREAEASALAAVLAGGSSIIAIGAGAPEHPPSADAIRAARTMGWRVIFLDASIDSVQSRLAHMMGDRPALTALSPSDELATLYARRRPVYLSLADRVVDASAPSPESVVSAVEGAAS